MVARLTWKVLTDKATRWAGKLMGIKNVGLTFGPNVLLKYRPKHAALLATVSNAWAAVEIALTDLLGYLVRCHRMTHGGEPVAYDPFTYELWDTFNSVDHRFFLIRAAFRARIKNDTLRVALEDLFADVRRSSRTRNRLVHAAYAVSGGYQKEIISTKLRPFDAENEQPVRIKDLQDAIKEISESAIAVRSYQRRVEAFKDSTLPLPPPPPTPSGKTITFTTMVDSPQVYDPPLEERPKPKRARSKRTS